MPSGVYVRTEKHREALRVPRPGSGAHEVSMETKQRMREAALRQRGSVNFTQEWDKETKKFKVTRVCQSSSQ